MERIEGRDVATPWTSNFTARHGGHRFLTLLDVALDRRPLGAILVRQIVIATLFRFVVNVKFYFLMSY